MTPTHMRAESSLSWDEGWDQDQLLLNRIFITCSILKTNMMYMNINVYSGSWWILLSVEVSSVNSMTDMWA